MTDVLSPERRSQVMRNVRSSGNKSTEVVLANFFRKHHFSGWRRHLPVLGKPDFVFPKQKVCVFVDGCFWHGCPNCCRIPKSNVEFWEMKILGNALRDVMVSSALRRQGWKILRIWEHDLKPANSSKLRRRVQRILTNQS